MQFFTINQIRFLSIGPVHKHVNVKRIVMARHTMFRPRPKIKNQLLLQNGYSERRLRIGSGFILQIGGLFGRRTGFGSLMSYLRLRSCLDVMGLGVGLYTF